jgi:hypothetical protein
VQLADNAATSSGTSTTLALTPAGAASVYFPYCDYTAKGQIAVATGSNTYAIVGVGTNGQVLKACSTCTSGVFWDSAAGVAATPTALGTMYGIGLPDAGANFAVGSSALQSVTSGLGNSAVSIGALPLLTSGCYNVALGVCALYAETVGSFNTAIGTGALDTQNGGEGNTAVGFGSGTAITTGDCNNLLGSNSGCALTTGCFNVIIGHNAGRTLTTACRNVIVGGGAGCVATGDSNIFIGDLSGSNNTTGSNNIAIGQSSVTSTASVSNEVTIGNSSNNSYRIYGTWSNISDARDKKDVEDLALGLEFVNNLRPVKYVWDYRDGSTQNGNSDIGFIAQELLEVQEEADAGYAQFVNQSNPEQLMVTPGKLIPVLVNAIKELKAEVEALKAKLG